MSGGEFAMTVRRHVFGVRANVKDNVHYVDDDTIAYPVGRTVLLYNQPMNTQKFLQGNERGDVITAMALTSNKKFIAIANAGDTPSIEIYDTTTRRRKKNLPLTVQDLGSRDFVCLGFSADNRHLVAQGGAPEWNLIFWTWDRLKSLTMFPIGKDAQPSPRGGDARGAKGQHVSCVSNNPADPYHICASGDGVMKFFRFADSQLKPGPTGGFARHPPQNVLCHRWVHGGERILASCASGDILLFDNCEFHSVLPGSPSDGLSLDALVVTPNGFVAGGAEGWLHVYENNADHPSKYRKTRSVTIAPHDSSRDDETPPPTVRGLCTSPQGDSLAVSTSNGAASVYGQLYAIKMDHLEGSKPSSGLPLEYLVAPFHRGQITGIDTCVRKPLVVTCSTDHTVRVWDYNANTMEICKDFGVEATSISMHPSGLHLLVGFADKLRFLNLYGDDMRVFVDFNIRSCPACKFSNGGQWFAAVHGHAILLYNTFTCEQVAHLRGPASKIRAVEWVAPDDTRLVCAGTDGSVYDFNVREGRKENDHITKSTQYTSLASNGGYASGLMWGVGTDKKLREFELSNFSIANEFDVGAHAFTALAYAGSHKILLAGAEDGTLRALATPVQSGMHQAEVLSAHCAPITQLALSFDQSLLFSVGDDGCLWVLDLKEHDGRATSKREVSYAEEILISKADLEDKHATIYELQNQVDELECEMTYLAQKRQIKHEERLKDAQERFQGSMDAEWSKFEGLIAMKKEQERTFTEIKGELAGSHNDDVARLQRAYQTKIQDAEARKQRYQQQLDDDRERYEREVQAADVTLEVTKVSMSERSQRALGVERSVCDELRHNERELIREHQEIQNQLEHDTDDVIEVFKERYEKRLQGERDRYLQLKGENGIMRKKFAHQKRDIKEKSEEIANLMETLTQLSHRISRIEHEIESLKQEIKDRDDLIGHKEKSIYDLKRRNQELEKYKFVLDFKIRELKSQIEPRQEEIAAAKQKIKEMDHSLEGCHEHNLALKTTIDTLKEKIDGQQAQIHKLANRLKDGETYKNRVCTDLFDMVQKIQDNEALYVAVAELYRKHCKGSLQRSLRTDRGLEVEFDRQRQFLSKTVESLKKKIVEENVAHKYGSNRTMQENAGLIQEIQDLRREIKQLKAAQSAERAAASAAAIKEAQAAHASGRSSPRARGGALGSPRAGLTPAEQAQKEIDMQHAELTRLRQRVAEAEEDMRRRRAANTRELPGLRDAPAGSGSGSGSTGGSPNGPRELPPLKNAPSLSSLLTTA